MAWPAHMQRPANGAGKGDGWGGPAKGAGRGRIKPGDPDGIQAMSNDPDIKAQQAAKADLVREHIYGLVTKAAREETQLAAAVAYLNRVEGAPMQRAVVANVSDPSKLTDADLAAIAAGSRAAVAPASDDTAGPDGVVH